MQKTTKVTLAKRLFKGLRRLVATVTGGAILGIFAIRVAMLATAMFWNDSLESNGFRLKTFVRNISSLEYEVHGEFDLCGFKLYEMTQRQPQRAVYFNFMPFKQWANLGSGKITYVHNHPQDAPFSMNDLLGHSARHPQLRDRREIVVSQEFVYSLEAPNGWPEYEAARHFLAKKQSDFDHSSGSEEWFTPVFFLADRMVGDILQHQVVEVGLCTTDLLLQAYADEFGLVYTKTPLEEWLETS